MNDEQIKRMEALRDLLMPGLSAHVIDQNALMQHWKNIFDGDIPPNAPVPSLETHPDPTFTLSELEQAQDLIEKLKK